MKIKRILISQPRPESERSPYFDIARKYNVHIDFHPFIRVESLTASEFRRQRIYIEQHQAIIFTSKNAVDHFFKMCEELRYQVPESLKYFCQTEAIALYTQKYIVYRKRKIFAGNKDFSELIDLMKKHTCDRYLLVTSDVCKEDNIKMLEASKLNFSQAIFYKTVPNDMSEVGELNYDLIIFFSPEGIRSLFKNYPNFIQNNIRIGGFGANTTKTIVDHGLRLDLPAPTPEFPSMAMALDAYLHQVNNGK